MSECRHYQTIDVGENSFHRLALRRWRRGQLCFEIAGLDLGQHGKFFDALKVVRDPIDDLMTEATELFGRHVAEWRIVFSGDYGFRHFP